MRLSSKWPILATVGLAALALLIIALPIIEDSAEAGRSSGTGISRTGASSEPANNGITQVVLGHSLQGRPITATELGNPSSPNKVLVVGCIHGNECAGISIVRSLLARKHPSNVDLWVVPTLNPDGYAANTRGNARGVDLNRNFPYRWHTGRRGGATYPGRRPLSEPESRIAYSLIRRLHPDLTIWFHQALGLVDESGGNVAVERRYAALVGLPLKKLRRYPGSVTTWQNHAFPKATAFVVELGAGPLSTEQADRYADAIVELPPAEVPTG